MMVTRGARWGEGLQGRGTWRGKQLRRHDVRAPRFRSPESGPSPSARQNPSQEQESAVENAEEGELDQADDEQPQRRRHLPPPSPPRIDHVELLVGDVLVLLAFVCIKQIDAIVTAPDFPGWTAPLAFRYERWVEFGSFLTATIGTFCAVGFLSGSYAETQTRSMPKLVENSAFVTCITCLLLGAQLVLGVASTNGSFVGMDGWDVRLPLAASGIGEPWVTGVQLLGVCTGWRVMWYFFIDSSSFLRLERFHAAQKETERGVLDEAIRISGALVVASFVVLRILQAYLRT